MKSQKMLIVILGLLLVTVFSFADFYLNVGTVPIGNQNYMVYEFGPEFTIGPVTLGITLTTYATDLTTGQFYFGYPGSGNPSTNIIDGLNITSLGLDFGNFWVKYGQMRPITYGMGFVFKGYLNPQARTVDFGLRFGRESVSVHVPYQIAQLTNLTFVESDSLYTAVAKSRILFFDLSVFGGVDMSSFATNTASSNPLSYAAGISLTNEILGFNIGAEADIQSWKDGTLGYGAFGGVFGNFGMLEILAGPYLVSDGFSPWLISKNYRAIKSESDFGPEKYKADMGYIASVGLTVSPYGKAVVFLKGNFDGDMTLSGEGLINIPAIGGANGLVLYGYIYDENPFEGGQVLDSNTIARLTLAYPVFGNFFAGVKYVWENLEWKQTAFVGGAANF
jgi:hypothetical protein